MAISSWVKKVSKLPLMVVGITSAAAFSVTDPTHAYTIYFGENLNNNPVIPLSSFLNAQTAEANFLCKLADAGTETFESFAPKTYSPLTLTTPGGQTATLNGNGSITTIPAGTTNGVGRYSIDGTKYWEAEAKLGKFWITFNQPIAAFGFYGIDIGDFGGQLVLHLTGNSTRQLTAPNTTGSYGSTDGSVLYFGIIAENPDEYFTSVLFDMSTGEGDFFAFDRMTFGNIKQAISSEVSSPEPSSVAPVSSPEPSSVTPVSIPEPSSVAPVSIPEPSSAFGAIALGATIAGSLLLRQQRRR